MVLTAFYFSAAALGIYCGKRLSIKEKNIPFTKQLQVVLIAILIGSMGAKIGNNKGIIDSLDQIGISSLIIVSMSITFSVLLVYLYKKILKNKGEE